MEEITKLEVSKELESLDIILKVTQKQINEVFSQRKVYLMRGSNFRILGIPTKRQYKMYF